MTVMLIVMPCPWHRGTELGRNRYAPSRHSRAAATSACSKYRYVAVANGLQNVAIFFSELQGHFDSFWSVLRLMLSKPVRITMIQNNPASA
jgi:hypothetical protein